MKIKELRWLMQNRELLSEEDAKRLKSYNLFEQYDAGEIHQDGVAVLEVLAVVQELYDQYQPNQLLS